MPLVEIMAAQAGSPDNHGVAGITFAGHIVRDPVMLCLNQKLIRQQRGDTPEPAPGM